MATSNSYLSSKAQLDSLLSDISFVEVSEGFIVINPFIVKRLLGNSF